MARRIIYLRSKPYYYYGTYNTWQGVEYVRKKHPRTKYYYIKSRNKYRLYLNKQL